MSPKQNLLYWRTWNKVRKSLIELGGYDAAEADAERHEIHRNALGRDLSSKEFSNRDLDIVLDHFRRYLVLEDGPTSGPSRADTQPVARLIYAIEQLGLPEPYIAAIARDQFRTSDWRQLSEAELTRLRFTCNARSRAKRQTKT